MLSFGQRENAGMGCVLITGCRNRNCALRRFCSGQRMCRRSILPSVKPSDSAPTSSHGQVQYFAAFVGVWDGTDGHLRAHAIGVFGLEKCMSANISKLRTEKVIYG